MCGCVSLRAKRDCTRTLLHSIMQFSVEIGVCWGDHTWEVLGPYDISAATDEEAKVLAADTVLDTYQRSFISYLFTYSISAEENNDNE